MRIEVTIPDEMEGPLGALAEGRGITPEELVAVALKSYLKAYTRPEFPPGASVLDLVRDLVGSLEGPGDLSTNRRYMEEFGE